jgi:tetratricopeptide (TPR) repeat protein
MKRAVAGILLLAVSVAGAYAFFETRRERNYRACIESGDDALARGDTSAAIESFSGAIALKSDSMLGYLRRGEAYQRRNDLQTALRDLLAASELDPTALRPLELLGDVNATLLRYDRAAQRYQAYLAIDDQSARVLYKLGLVQFRAGRAAVAEESLRRALALNDRFAEAYYLRGLCLRDLKRVDQSLASLKRAVDLAPALLPAREELADLYGRIGRLEDRFGQLQVLAGLDPGPSRGVALGLAYARHGMLDRAIPALRDVAERYPEDPYVYVALGRVWLEAAQTRSDHVALGKALEALEHAVDSDPTSEALTLYGRARLLAADHDGAERTLRQATERLPADPLAFFYLAEAAERAMHPEVARQALLDFRAIEGEEPDGRRRAAMAQRIGDLTLRINDPAGAVAWYQRAVEAGPPDAGLFVRLADALWKCGNADGARAAIAEALEEDPVNAAAKALLKRMR